MTVKKLVAQLLLRGMECQRRYKYREVWEQRLAKALLDYILSDEDE